jgi:hypothetical protein
MAKISAGVAVVVIIVIVAVVAYFLTQPGPVAEFPVYPGAEVYAEMTPQMAASTYANVSLPAGAEIRGGAYSTTDSVDTVISWYRGQMAGWTKVYDNVATYEIMGYQLSIGWLGYETGDKGASILAMSGGTVEGTVVVYLEGPKSLFENIYFLS